MVEQDAGIVEVTWDEGRIVFVNRAREARAKLRVGQRYHRVDLPSVVWRVTRVYRDHQGLEHATLTSNTLGLDPKTLSAGVLLDRARYRRV